MNASDLMTRELVTVGPEAPLADAIRLMLDRDNIPAENIAGAIRWCQADEFWRSNILSASKLREKLQASKACSYKMQRKSWVPQLT